MYDSYESKDIGMVAGQPCRAPTVRERLEQQKQEMTRQLEKVNAAIDALDSNPGVAEVLELLGKAGF